MLGCSVVTHVRDKKILSFDVYNLTVDHEIMSRHGFRGFPVRACRSNSSGFHFRRGILIDRGRLIHEL